MSPTPPTDVSALIEDWRGAPDISARSVLVTVFGDTVVPVADRLPVPHSLWLAQLFKLTDEFGFSDRLVRTSMFRLAAEGWLTNERVGRQSRYQLTELALRESKQAAQRIYHDDAVDWAGTWTLVILDHPLAPPEAQSTIAQHLGWSGFIKLGRGLLASPTVSSGRVNELIALIEPGTQVAVAAAEFANLADLVASGFFSDGFSTDETAAAYQGFVDRYGPMADAMSACTSHQAFALRTMLIHDLRRIRLRSPDIPAELLPSGWIGHQAHALAAGLYETLSARAAEALSAVLELDYPVQMIGRFDR